MNNEQIEIIKLEIGKLSIQEDEYLIFKFPEESMLIERAEGIAYRLGEALPELKHRMIVILGDVEIYVVNKK